MVVVLTVCDTKSTPTSSSTSISSTSLAKSGRKPITIIGGDIKMVV